MNLKKIFSAYLDMWKRTVDFKGVTNRADFWFAFLVHSVIIVLLCLVSYIIVINTFFLPVFLFPLGYAFVSILSFTSLCMRRLHDAGKSRWWVLLIFFGFGIGLILCASATTSWCISNIAQGVYGPPPSNWEESTNVNQTVYGPPEWFAETNINVDVYGPPEYFEEPDVEETSVSYAETTVPDVMYTEITDVVTPSEEPVPEWTKEENVPMLVYGPPAYFESISREKEQTAFDEEANVPQAIYGPPVDDNIPVETSETDTDGE